MTENALKPKWQARFDYFDKEEKMSKQEKKDDYKKASFSIKFNFLGLFFGPIYFLILGLWRKALVLVVLHLLLLAITGIVLNTLDTFPGTDSTIINSVSYGFGAIYAAIANKAYYLHVRKTSRSWNPFEGLAL